ncbi:MAG: TIGR02099 family protein [Idiomarina sp.]|nr:TIGR02099 family protein [Idiomarina sp.]PHQ77013.1 MAG: TIGR02099 family protein [Idiomarina sp.]
MSKGLLWLLNKLWLSLALLLVLAAVLMSVMRYALPHIPDVSAQVEAELEQRLQQPIEIETLAMSWHRQGPALDVTGVTLKSGEDAPVQFQVDEISVVLDFWQSLLQRQLVAQEFILNQATIAIDLRSLQSDSDQPVSFTRFENLFLQQLERFSLTDSELNVINLAGNRRSVVIEKLSWLNQGNRHQGVGQFRVRDFTRNSLDFIIQLEGNQLSTVDGQIYVDSRQIDISPWLEQQLTRVDITQSNVNFTSWLTLVDGDISSGLLQLRDNQVTARVNERDIALHIAKGTVAIEPQQQGWLLNVKPLTVEINQQPINLPLISWQSQPNLQQLSAKKLPIPKLLSALPLQDDSLSTSLAGLAGSMDVWLQRDAVGDAYWQVHSDDLAKSNEDGSAAFSPLSLTIQGKNAQFGTWLVAADSLQLENTALAEQPWDFDDLRLNGHWQRQGEQWQTSLQQGQITYADMPLALSGRLLGGGSDLATNEAPQIELKVSSQAEFSVATARQLLPSVMGRGVKNYLTEALQGGVIAGLEAVWRGPVNEFPDADMNGVFNARVDFAGLDYRFRPEWPALQQTPIRLDFYQAGLFMFTDGGKLMDVQIDEVSASIPELTNASTGLQLTSSVSGPAASIEPVFSASPLTSVAETLRQVQPRSRVAGQFSLDIPFDGSREVDVRVNTDLTDQSFYVAAIDQTFRAREGELVIHNAQVQSEELVLEWYGMPITTEVVGSSGDSDYLLTVDTSLDWQVEPLLDALPSQGWQKYFYGAVNGSGQLQLTLGDTIESQWRSQYDLTGLQSNLPQPLAKEFGENWQLGINLSGNDQQLRLNANVADRLSWNSRWQPGSKQWQSAQLVIGKEPTQQKAKLAQRSDAFVISAQLPQLNVGEWYDLVYFLQQNQNGESTNSGPSFTPDYILASTPQLNWAGQTFVDAELEVWPSNQQWFGRVFANDLALDVAIPEDFLQQPIVVNADFIQLSSSLGVNSTNNLREKEAQWQWVKRLPAIDINCKTCKLDDKSFVDLNAEVRPINGGIELSKFSTQSNNSSLQASGYWLVADGNPVTQISGNLQSEDFGDLLREYGLETAIRDSSATLEFGLNWQGHPHQIDFTSLGGSMQWQLGQGYLAEVSDGGARLFSLLSLDGILRKLTLDFRDIFSQGMFYTELSGSVQLANGIATTNDTQLLGSAGNMEITGTTNLVTNALDYQLTYAPKVTSSLPVILAWMVNPPSGLAALLIDKVLQDAEVISQLRYQVTGTIDNPQVTEVERDSRPVDIPQLESEPQSQQLEEGNDASRSNGNPANQP